MDTYYNSYNDDLKKKFGCRVYKVSIDAGFTCPNRDGSKGIGGCVFCDEMGSSSRTNGPAISITDQLLKNIDVRRTRYKAQKFIAYFQSFTNTYAPVSHLKKLYDEAIAAHPDIVGLAISTRADCVDAEKLALMASYRSRVPYVCVEYGLQTIHDRTLLRLNRQETHDDFVRAIQLTQALELDHCVHVILGLPFETREDVMATADKIAEYRIQGVKIHFLVAMERTPLAEQYHRQSWQPLSMDETVSLTCDFLERLPPECVIYRIGGNGHPRHAIAPTWVWQKKKEVIDMVNEEFQRRGTRQGCRAGRNS
ncbi:MAG: family radical protein [Parachlamydiales bacterium]|nr:family radical protein [Parachlamydiales bacterium]